MKKFLQVTMLTAIYTFLKMIAGFIIGKVIAVYSGPAGLAMLGQIQGFMTILTGVAASPVSTGLIKYTAENWQDGEKACKPWWSACFRVTGILFLIVIPLSIIFSEKLSSYLFETDNYSWVVIISACILPLSVLNTSISSVLNGQQKYKQFIMLGMLSVVVSTLTMIFLVIFFGINGALIAAAFNGAIAGIVLFIACIKQQWIRIKYWFARVEPYHIKGIVKYTLMALTTATSVPLSLIFIRNILISQTNWVDAGNWQAVWKISEVYLSVVTMALTTYFLPRLAILKESNLIKKEINITAPYVIGVTILMGLVIYLLRDLSISILFTEEFRPARDLFAAQLLGDILKISGFLYAYTLQAQGHGKLFIVSEVLFSLLFVISAYFLVNIYGVHGANYAYVLTYTIYFFFSFIFTNFVNVRRVNVLG